MIAHANKTEELHGPARTAPPRAAPRLPCLPRYPCMVCAVRGLCKGWAFNPFGWFSELHCTGPASAVERMKRQQPESKGGPLRRKACAINLHNFDDVNFAAPGPRTNGRGRGEHLADAPSRPAKIYS